MASYREILPTATAGSAQDAGTSPARKRRNIQAKPTEQEKYSFLSEGPTLFSTIPPGRVGRDKGRPFRNPGKSFLRSRREEPAKTEMEMTRHFIKKKKQRAEGSERQETNRTKTT